MKFLHVFLIIFLIQLKCSLIVNGQQQENNDDCCEEYCFSTDNRETYVPNIHYSTKTSYESVKGKETQLKDALIVPSECKPTKIWILSRHGTRLPDTEFINEMGKLSGIRNETIRNYANRTVKITKGRLCTPDLINIKAWKLNTSITPSMSDELVPQGIYELQRLAMHYKQVFPEILNQSYDSDIFAFGSSTAERAKDSLAAFITGLFGDDKTVHYVKRMLNDSFIRPHESCDLWVEQHKKEKNDPESETNKFEVSELFNRTVINVSKRLGFTSYYLENKYVDLIWDMCRYEQAWNIKRLSAWCAAFTPKQNQVLEYKQDLKYYYKFAYGNKLNTKMACYTVQDMLKHLESSKPNPQAKIYFSHTEAIQFFLVALGGFKDSEALKADNMEEMKDRQWQTSSIGPFASNLIAIRYDCPPGSENDPKILFLLNEKPLNLEGCKLGLCDLSYLITKYEEFYNANCQEYYCSRADSHFKLTFTLSSSILLYLIYLFSY